MPGPTTERLDDDFRLLRDDMQDIKVILARMDTRLAELETLKVDAKTTALSLAMVEARLAWLIGGGKWLGSIFALAAVYGTFSIWGRLGIVETQIKSVDGRLAVVEIQIRSVDSRLGGVETQLKSVDGRLGIIDTQTKLVSDQLTEIKGAINRRPPDTSAELDERIRRIARAVVDEVAKQPTPPKPSP